MYFGARRTLRQSEAVAQNRTQQAENEQTQSIMKELAGKPAQRPIWRSGR